MAVSDNLSLPRILCLHGGGVTSQVFRLQCRAIIAELATTFRLVFIDGPYLSDPHKDIVAVYGNLGPFYTWLPWHDDQPDLPPSTAAGDIMNACLVAMDQDHGLGPWVGVLGFSQGAKVAASLLWAQQRAEALSRSDVDDDGDGDKWARTKKNKVLVLRSQFKFGVFMAGSAPIIHLDLRLARPRHVGEAALFSSAFRDDFPQSPHGQHVLDLPSLHVHGLRDIGLEAHRRLLDLYCMPGRTRLVEWDGGHRLPFKSGDVQAVVTQILDMAKECGAL